MERPRAQSQKDVFFFFWVTHLAHTCLCSHRQRGARRQSHHVLQKQHPASPPQCRAAGARPRARELAIPRKDRVSFMSLVSSAPSDGTICNGQESTQHASDTQLNTEGKKEDVEEEPSPPTQTHTLPALSTNHPHRIGRPWAPVTDSLVHWNFRSQTQDHFISKIPRPGGLPSALAHDIQAPFLGPPGDRHRLFYLLLMFILAIPPGYREEASVYPFMLQQELAYEVNFHLPCRKLRFEEYKITSGTNHM